MRYKPSGIPKDMNSLGVLGYLIIVNKQIHSYQLDILDEYLLSMNLSINDTVIENIIDGKDNSVKHSQFVGL